jgi:hypothetical protein
MVKRIALLVKLEIHKGKVKRPKEKFAMQKAVLRKPLSSLNFLLLIFTHPFPSPLISILINLHAFLRG